VTGHREQRWSTDQQGRSPAPAGAFERREFVAQCSSFVASRPRGHYPQRLQLSKLQAYPAATAAFDEQLRQHMAFASSIGLQWILLTVAITISLSMLTTGASDCARTSECAARARAVC
jgi:hypothetical protein